MFPRFGGTLRRTNRCDSGCAVSNSGFGRVRPRLDVAEEGLGVRPHRRTARRARSCRPTSRSRPPAARARPLPPTANSRALAKASLVSDAAIAARCDQRVAVGDMQLRPPLPLRFCGLDSIGFRERREQRLQPRRSLASPASAQSLQERARARRAPRPGGQSIDRPSRSSAPLAGRSCARPALARWRWRRDRLPRRGRDGRGSAFGRMSPRMQCKWASVKTCPVRCGQRQRLVDARQGRGRGLALTASSSASESEISLRRRPRMFGVFRHALATLGESRLHDRQVALAPNPDRSSPGPI